MCRIFDFAELLISHWNRFFCDGICTHSSFHLQLRFLCVYMSLGLFLQSVLSFCTWLAWLNTALAWRILCNCAQLHHQLAFCSGTILFTLDPLAPHGQQLAFCRGAPYRWTASFTLWLFVAFCSGANFNFWVYLHNTDNNWPSAVGLCFGGLILLASTGFGSNCGHRNLTPFAVGQHRYR